jgi:CheY-like chemotaxis protein
VLVVDDDPQILRLLETMLKPRRVKVFVTPRATEALQISEREAVHLLISDVGMPEMDGRKLAERVLKLHPQASVLLISGSPPEAPAGSCWRNCGNCCRNGGQGELPGASSGRLHFKAPISEPHRFRGRSRGSS